MGGKNWPVGGQIGVSQPRASTRRLVAGRGRYVDDISIKGELHAAFLRSPYAHAGFRIVDCSEALSLGGVVRVLTADDLEAVCKSWTCYWKTLAGMVSPEQSALAKARAIYQGEPIALVIASSRAIAEDALDLIQVEWEEHEAVGSLSSGLDPDSPVVHPSLESNLCWKTDMKAGDTSAAFASAAMVVSERLSFDRKTGVPLEPRGILANYDPSTDSLLVHMSHQMPHQMQLHFAELLDLSPADVRVVCSDVGGGFGVKMHVYQEEVAVCAASKIVGRPVKFIADRIESLVSDIHAREHIVEGRMALDDNGKIIGFEVDDLQGMGAYSVYPRSSLTEGIGVLRTVGAPYQFEHYTGSLRAVLQNKTMTGQYRSVGYPIACALTERLIDIAALKRNEDPLEFRRRNIWRQDQLPCNSAQGARMVDLSHERCLDKMIELADVPALRAQIAEMRAQGRVVGLGFSTFVEFTATGAEIYGRAGVNASSVDTVSISLEPSGQLRVQASAAEIGQGIQQGLAQIVCDAVGGRISDVRVYLGDTAAAPHGGGAWASRGAAITGEAAWGAGRKLRQQILDIAKAMLQLSSEQLDVRDGYVVEIEAGRPRISLAEIAHVATFRAYELPQGTSSQLSAVHTYGRDTDLLIPTNGLQASFVEIDPRTGIVRLLKHWVVEDCGRVINPLLVDEQIRGGVVQGIGEAIFEACRYDANGQFLSGSLADYLLPMAGEMPDIIVGHVETPYSGSEVGAKGVGEAGTCGAAGAVLNAVNDALAPLNKSISSLPMTPMRILQALGVLSEAAAP
jgi:carbon-monoxide dehydrogenase large subunit